MWVISIYKLLLLPFTGSVFIEFNDVCQFTNIHDPKIYAAIFSSCVMGVKCHCFRILYEKTTSWRLEIFISFHKAYNLILVM